MIQWRARQSGEIFSHGLSARVALITNSSIQACSTYHCLAVQGPKSQRIAYCTRLSFIERDLPQLPAACTLSDASHNLDWDQSTYLDPCPPLRPASIHTSCIAHTHPVARRATPAWYLAAGAQKPIVSCWIQRHGVARPGGPSVCSSLFLK